MSMSAVRIFFSYAAAIAVTIYNDRAVKFRPLFSSLFSQNDLYAVAYVI
jgi:hypothetical protein